VDIDGTGRVAMIAVEVSSGYPALDRAAVEAVRAWQFEPARRDGEAVLSIMSLGITYQLEGGLRW
jgi:protein TonB